MKREFYICDEKLFCLTDGRTEEVTEKSHALIEEMLQRIETFYPEAFKALSESYDMSQLNQPYYNFLRVRRFLKCNFGDLDTSDHDDKEGSFNFEKIHCPLRGECKYDGVICCPKFDSHLSDAEMRVMRLYFRNNDVLKIADKLYLSGHTVKNHIRNSYAKLGVHTRGEFITYANRNHLFD